MLFKINHLGSTAMPAALFKEQAGLDYFFTFFRAKQPHFRAISCSFFSASRMKQALKHSFFAQLVSLSFFCNFFGS